MDQKLNERLRRIELQLHDLRTDLNKLMSIQRQRGKSCGEVATCVKSLAIRQAEIGETVGNIFETVFPKHGKYLIDIDAALARAKKKKPRTD